MSIQVDTHIHYRRLPSQCAHCRTYGPQSCVILHQMSWIFHNIPMHVTNVVLNFAMFLGDPHKGLALTRNVHYMISSCRAYSMFLCNMISSLTTKPKPNLRRASTRTKLLQPAPLTQFATRAVFKYPELTRAQVFNQPLTIHNSSV